MQSKQGHTDTILPSQHRTVFFNPIMESVLLYAVRYLATLNITRKIATLSSHFREHYEISK